MGTGPSVLVPGLGELFLPKPRRKLHQRRPQPSVDVRDLAVDQFADQHLGAFSDSLCHTKDLMTLRMPPPATSNWAAGNGLGEAWHRPPCGLEHDAVTLDEGQSLFRAHGTPLLRLFGPARFALARSAASFARNFAMRSINFTGTGWESGKRIVPLLTLYGARSSLNAATR